MNETNKQKSLPLDKILTISAKDYCDIVGRHPAQYEAVGVHMDAPGSVQAFIELVPGGTEVIVDYRFFSSSAETQKYDPTNLIPHKTGDMTGPEREAALSARKVVDHYFASGTALIPR